MKIIVNADDFGLCREVNQAVIQAHRQGVLTSASLMVTADGADEAVRLARQTPTLAVGLHIVVVDGRPALPAQDIPKIVDTMGQFAKSPLRQGFRLLGPAARKQLGRELAAQFELFAATGLRLSHVDGHHHMHCHPSVFPLLIPLARKFGAAGIRIPTEGFIWSILGRWCRRQLHENRLAAPRYTFGLRRSGRMDEAYVIRVLQNLNGSPAELFFHPTTGTRLDPKGPNPGDLQTLLSPTVRRTIETRGLRLSTYADLPAD